MSTLDGHSALQALHSRQRSITSYSRLPVNSSCGTLPGDRVSERVGAPARGVLFVEGAHVRRAHGAVEFFAALAHAAAHFHRAREAALRGEIQRRARLPRFVLRADLERLRHRRRVDDLARVHKIFRIEGALDLAEGIVKRRAEKLRVEVAPRQAVAMLARHGAVEFEHEIGDRVGDGNHLVALALFLEIDQRADMHAADGTMAVVSGDGIVACNDFAETLDKLRQLGRRHRGVFDEGDRLLVAFDAEQQTEPGFAHAPDRFHLFRLECQRRGVADRSRACALLRACKPAP